MTLEPPRRPDPDPVAAPPAHRSGDFKLGFVGSKCDQCGTLHHYSGERSPADIMRQYVDALPSGSFVTLSHFFDPEAAEDSALARRMEEIFLHSPMGSGRFRTRAEIESMLGGLDLVDPGLTLCAMWWPDGPRIKPLAAAQRCIVGAVGRKP